MSRTLFSRSVKSPKSRASASAASTAFWACCSNRTKNSLFFGRSDRRMGVLLWRHILRHRDRWRKVLLGDLSAYRCDGAGGEDQGEEREDADIPEDQRVAERISLDHHGPQGLVRVGQGKHVGERTE